MKLQCNSDLTYQGCSLYLKTACYLCMISEEFGNVVYTVKKNIAYFIGKKIKAKTKTEMLKFKLKMFCATTYQAADVLHFTVLFLTYTQVFANRTYH